MGWWGLGMSRPITTRTTKAAFGAGNDAGAALRFVLFLCAQDLNAQWVGWSVGEEEVCGVVGESSDAIMHTAALPPVRSTSHRHRKNAHGFKRLGEGGGGRLPVAHPWFASPSDRVGSNMSTGKKKEKAKDHQVRFASYTTCHFFCPTRRRLVLLLLMLAIPLSPWLPIHQTDAS